MKAKKIYFINKVYIKNIRIFNAYATYLQERNIFEPVEVYERKTMSHLWTV